MERRLFAVILIFNYVLINSCAFDPPAPKRKELGGGYYISFDKYSPNDGLTIGYTKDKEQFKFVATNCIDIYRGRDIVMFSKSLFEGDTANIEYYTFDINAENELKKIGKVSFERGISVLEKMDLSSLRGVSKSKELDNSLNTDTYMPGFDFKLFKNTPVWELAKAVEKEDIGQIAVILKDTALKVDHHESKFGNTLLMLAVVNKKQKSVKKLLEVGANPNERSNLDNATALIYSCENYSEDCDTAILKLLMGFNGDVNTIKNVDRIEDNGAYSIVKTTPLMTAAENNCLGIVKVLVNAGADINLYTYYEGYGAITEALIQDNIEIVKFLIIDKKARIPEYCFIRNRGEKDEQKLSIIDMLNEQHYDTGSENYRYKEELIHYLKK